MKNSEFFLKAGKSTAGRMASSVAKQQCGYERVLL
jgi:hypothetical protein